MIELKNIRLYAHHGVLPQEQKLGAWFRVTVSLDYPLETAAETDDLNDTLNYAEVAEVIKTEMQTPSKLLEHVAGRIAKALRTQYPLLRDVKISLTKENPPLGMDCEGVTVTI